MQRKLQNSCILNPVDFHPQYKLVTFYGFAPEYEKNDVFMIYTRFGPLVEWRFTLRKKADNMGYSVHLRSI